jgi:hypothetical protein
MNSHHKLPAFGLLVGALVLLAIGVGAVAWLRIDPTGDQGSGLSETFDYDLEKYQKIDPALVRYRQTAEIPAGMREARAVAVGPEDRIFVAGDKAISVFSPDGKKLKEIALGQEPYCLAVGNAEHKFPGRTYVGMRDHIEVYNAEAARESVWDRPPGKRSVLTSITAAEEDVFVADAGALIVWHYDLHGKLLGRIGRRDPERGIHGFVVPSPYFDVTMAPDGLLRVVNPGAHRIEAYTFDGYLELFWGKRGLGVEAFCGCCNPSNIAILADGRFVTAEKGIPRVKIYSASGEFECVVVGPDILAPNRSATVETREDLRLYPVDLAADSRGRILVLDPAAGCVRIFKHN